MNVPLQLAAKYLAIIAGSGLAGFAGFSLLLILFAAREVSVWDLLYLVQLAGLPCAALTFHFLTIRVLDRVPVWWIELPLFFAVQFGLPPFFRFVVQSELTGRQGASLAVMGLSAGGLVLASLSPRRKSVAATVAAVGSR